MKDNPILPRFGFAICLSSAQTASCPRRERYNSADIFTRYRHQDASTVMSEPTMVCSGISPRRGRVHRATASVESGLYALIEYSVISNAAGNPANPAQQPCNCHSLGVLSRTYVAVSVQKISMNELETPDLDLIDEEN